MALGGARPGAGRPPGSQNKKTKEILEIAARDGITPLEVMIDNMRWFYKESLKSRQLLETLDRYADQNETSEIDKEARAETKSDTYSLMLKAQDCAKDAAQYIHPRLATVNVGNKPGETFQTENVGQRELFESRIAQLVARKREEQSASGPH